jgi:hypothetical protein
MPRLGQGLQLNPWPAMGQPWAYPPPSVSTGTSRRPAQTLTLPPMRPGCRRIGAHYFAPTTCQQPHRGAIGAPKRSWKRPAGATDPRLERVNAQAPLLLSGRICYRQVNSKRGCRPRRGRHSPRAAVIGSEWRRPVRRMGQISMVRSEVLGKLTAPAPTGTTALASAGFRHLRARLIRRQVHRPERKQKDDSEPCAPNPAKQAMPPARAARVSPYVVIAGRAPTWGVPTRPDQPATGRPPWRGGPRAPARTSAPDMTRPSAFRDMTYASANA